MTKHIDGTQSSGGLSSILCFVYALLYINVFTFGFICVYVYDFIITPVTQESTNPPALLIGCPLFCCCIPPSFAFVVVKIFVFGLCLCLLTFSPEEPLNPPALLMSCPLFCYCIPPCPCLCLRCCRYLYLWPLSLSPYPLQSGNYKPTCSPNGLPSPPTASKVFSHRPLSKCKYEVVEIKRVWAIFQYRPLRECKFTNYQVAIRLRCCIQKLRDIFSYLTTLNENQLFLIDSVKSTILLKYVSILTHLGQQIDSSCSQPLRRSRWNNRTGQPHWSSGDK